MICRFRFTVYENLKPFAYVHAATAVDAVLIACMKTDGHDPKTCTAKLTKNGHHSAMTSTTLSSSHGWGRKAA